MVTGFLTGFFLGLSLIIAIGPQNTFLIRQGILGQHVFIIALFCSVSDSILIIIGVAGISLFLNNIDIETSNWLFGLSSIWLAGYGIIRLVSVFKSNEKLHIEITTSKKILPTLTAIAILTFLNPHVYLDTMVLIGSVSQQFSDENKFAFAFGALTASFIFFFSLAYGAKLLAPILKNPTSWRFLDSIVSAVMFTIAIKMAFAGNWL